MIIENEFPAIYCIPCVVHTLKLALKNACAAKDAEKNNVTYEQCFWITQIADDVNLIKFFMMGHSMRLSMYNNFNSLKLLSVAPTRLAPTIVMLKRYYSYEWLSEDPLRVPLHQDVELTDERKKCFRIYFDDMDVRRQVNL
ncbi:hypothetical protein GYH30_012105 [Glycine max]|uniref:DUF659 domain-containing protein n=1 Tax=Glycine max TaxID=3847 RepID=A0A0R0JSS2_SOYBN|nr:hypothetical protein GYH30_012105 [Glycine max]